MSQYWVPLGLTLLAGLSTGLGSIAIFFMNEVKKKHLALLMGFSAGVMIYISFAELLQEAIKDVGFTYANLAFFVGIFVMMLIDALIPHHVLNRLLGPDRGDDHERREYMSAGLMTALGIFIHNFPEGLVVFVSALYDINLGITLAVAIALHNIPEGMSVAVPIYYATGSRARAILYSIGSGLAEPLGALAALLILQPFINEMTLGLALAFSGGIMVFISFDELLPLSYRSDEAHWAITGIIAGMLLMFLTLIFI